MNNTGQDNLESRHAALFDKEAEHHSAHADRIGQHTGEIAGLHRSIEDLRRRIAVLESLHMLPARGTTCPNRHESVAPPRASESPSTT